MKRSKLLFTALFFCLLLDGCVTGGGMGLDFYNNIEKTNQLSPGMSHKEVLGILGKPKSTQFVGDKVTLKYSLHQEWKGFVPYYLVFDKKTARLVSWYADEAEYQRNQMMWMQTLQAFQEARKAEEQAQAQAQSSGQSGGGGGGTYMEGYDPNANYYTNDSYWAGSGYHYDD
ncbi:MAG: hypothetical protein B6I22_06040 [Desulfobacteraceae bacterium 4572_123]|nr:MAG: hypothetical protein B6I22_06040 [Desulfobacteraceae bacterium 4572_123]